eukprot:362362-Chlamydomonas_euryale.AAC.6
MGRPFTVMDVLMLLNGAPLHCQGGCASRVHNSTYALQFFCQPYEYGSATPRLIPAPGMVSSICYKRLSHRRSRQAI